MLREAYFWGTREVEALLVLVDYFTQLFSIEQASTNLEAFNKNIFIFGLYYNWIKFIILDFGHGKYAMHLFSLYSDYK